MTKTGFFWYGHAYIITCKLNEELYNLPTVLNWQRHKMKTLCPLPLEMKTKFKRINKKKKNACTTFVFLNKFYLITTSNQLVEVGQFYHKKQSYSNKCSHLHMITNPTCPQQMIHQLAEVSIHSPQSFRHQSAQCSHKERESKSGTIYND